MSLIIGIIFSIILFLIAKIIIQPYISLYYYRKKYGKQVETFFFPVIGALSLLKKDFKKYNDSCYSFFRQPVKKNPNMRAFITNIGPYPLVYLCDPKLIKEYCINFEKYQKLVFVLFFDIMIKESLLAKDGEQWKKLRNAFSPLFTNNEIKSYVQPIKKCGQELIDRLQIYEQTNQSVPLVKVMERTTGDVISRLLFGEEFVKLQLNGKQISEEVASLSMGLFNQTIGSPWTIFRNLFLGHLNALNTPSFLLSSNEKVLLQRLQMIRNIILEQIQQRMKLKEENKQLQPKNDFLDILINLYQQDQLNSEVKDKFTIEHMIQNCLQFYGAGIHTSSNVISFGLYYLAKYPDIQQKLKKEIDDNIDNLENINYDNINKLGYLLAFINETMRLSPPSPQFKPKKALQDHYIDDIFIKKGTFINVYLLGNCYNESNFKNSEEFRPERWLENQKLDEYIFIPFNTAPKNCLGQHLGLLEIKIILVYILKNFKLILNDDSEARKRYNGIVYTLDPNDSLIKLQKL